MQTQVTASLYKRVGNSPAVFYVRETWQMTLKREHQKLLKHHRFEHAGRIRDVLETDEWDNLRAIYAISDPAKKEIVYVGDTEQGRNLRGRLSAHMKDREKIGLVELNSEVYVHVMVTEFLVLTEFEEADGHLPRCNKRKTAKFARDGKTA